MKEKIFMLFAVVVFANSTCQAQSPVNAKKSSVAKQTSYSIEPIDPKVDTFPQSYVGHDLLKIVNSINPPAPKGEFESSAQYEVRLAAWVEKPYLGKIAPKDSIAIEIPSGQTSALSSTGFLSEYDADEEVMNANIRFSPEIGEVSWLDAFSTSKFLGESQAVTRMNVKFAVKSFEVTKLGLAFKDQQRTISVAIKMPKSEAQQRKHDLKAFVVVTLATPFRFQFRTNSKATLDIPVERRINFLGLSVKGSRIVFVDFKTGEVYAQYWI